MNKLWVFGASNCLPFGVNEEQGWAYQLSKLLNMKLCLCANDASDNLLIYHCYRENYHSIYKNDCVIVGWTHPDRKTFVYDSDNFEQTQILENSIFYETKTQNFIRSKNNIDNSITKYLNFMTPGKKSKGIEYYDRWYKNYHNNYEQILNLESYMHSVLHTCKTDPIFFYFSKESVKNIQTFNNVGYMLDFVLEKNCALSKHDAHLNANGNELWAKKVYNYIND